MKFIAKALFLVCVVLFGATYQLRADISQEKLYAVCDLAKSAVVKVYAQKKISLTDKNAQTRTLETLEVGTGFVISKSGTIMTSAYLTHKAEKIWVDFMGSPVEADLLGFDPLTTISILKMKGKFEKSDTKFITIDGASILPRVGTMLVSLSCEMGSPMSPRLGLAAGHNIDFGGNFLPTVYLRTTISTPRGATGGAVFDLNGKFVGITIASLPEMNGSFVLPARAAAKIRDDILNFGSPMYSWFGLRAEDSISPTGTKIIVTLVAENSPAKRGGFKNGDEIVEINSYKVSNNTELRDITFFIRPSERATFKVKRDGKFVNIDVVAEIMSPEIIGAAESNLSKKKTKSRDANVDPNGKSENRKVIEK